MLKLKIFQPLFLALCMSAALSTGLAAQITIVSRTPAQGCAGTCDGTIRIKPIDDAAVPFEVSIKDANGNIQQVSNLRGEHEFSGLCAGGCEITVTASSLKGCTVKVIQDYIQTTGGNSGGFQLELLKKVNESTRDFNDGSLSIKAIPAGNYTYLWSNGMTGAEIAGLTTGSYMVTATNAIGCQVIDSFALESCYDWVQDIDPISNQPTSRLDYVGKYFEVDISGGALSPQTTVDTLRALVKETGSSFVLATQSYQVKWVAGNGDSLGIGPILLIKKEDASRYSPIKAVVSNGCETHEKSRTLILCGANNTPEVVDYFVDQVQARCVYGNRVLHEGLISLAFPLTSTDPNLMVSILHNGSNAVSYTTDGGRTRATAWITQLSSGTHNFQVTMGSCINTFSVNVSQKSAALSFREYKDSCKYQLLCEGSPTGVFLNFAVVDANQGVPTTSNKCESPIFCTSDGVARKVGSIKEEDLKKIKIGLYVALLESELRRPLPRFDKKWLEGQIAYFENFTPCSFLKYCPSTMLVKDFGNPDLNFRSDSSLIRCVNGKMIIECGIGNKPTRVEYDPEFPPEDCCGQQVRRPLKYLLESYKAFKTQIYASKINTPFIGSELDLFLQNLEQNPDERANCATITFCLPNYTIFKNNMEQVRPCGEDGPRVLLVDSTYLNNSDGTIGQFDNCSALQWTIPALRDYYACLYTYDSNEFGHTFYAPPPNELAIPLSGEQQQSHLDYEEFFQLLAFGEIPNFYQGQPFKIFEDSLNHQYLHNFLTISSEGQICPKGLVEDAGTYGYYNYSHYRRNIDIQDFNNVHLAYEDWDNDRSFYIGTHVSNKDLYLQFKDSIQTWTLGLKSDSSIQIQHLSTFNEIIQVGGIATSNLNIKGMEVFQQDSIHTAFLAAFDFQGNLLKVHTIENIDTSARVVFSENRAGAIVLAGKSKQNWIKVDGDTVTFSSNQTGFIVKANELDSLQLLNKIDKLGAAKLRDISYAEGRSQFGLLVENVGNITPAGSIPVASSGNGVAILLFANNGNFTQSRHFSAQGLLLDQMDMTYGRNDGLIWGFTFSGSLNWGSQVFTSKGNEDIGLVKFDSNGDVEWHKSYGSQDRETVSHLLYENEVLYFGGQLRGNTQVRKIGSYYFINPTSFKNRTYISYVLDTLSTATTELTSLKTEDVFKSNQPIRVDAQLKVYPNPFKSEVVLEFQSSQAMNVVVDIRNELGSQVKSFRQNTVVGFNQQKISTEDLPIGFYYLSLYTREGKLIGVQKLVKLE
jgi:hypothetical protein